MLQTMAITDLAQRLGQRLLPPLENGDRLAQDEFERRSRQSLIPQADSSRQ